MTNLKQDAERLLEELGETRLRQAVPYLERLRDAAEEESGLMALIGLRSTSKQDGECVMECQASAHLLNPYGLLHGGVLFAALDTAMGGAVTSVLAEGETCATVEAKINYLAPVTEGKIVATGKVVQKGRSLAVAEARAVSENGRLLAVMTGTFMVQSNPHP